MKKLVKWFVGPWALLCAIYVTATTWQAFAAGTTPPIASWYLGKGTTYGPKVAPFVDTAGQLAGEAVTVGGEQARGFSTTGLGPGFQALLLAAVVLLIVLALSGRKSGNGKGKK